MFRLPQHLADFCFGVSVEVIYCLCQHGFIQLFQGSMSFEESWGVKASPTFSCGQSCRELSYSDSMVRRLLYSDNET
ncbi:hypothetical protein PAHAL_6G073700 [Panicum hallii]|uniref:Uncharacterized protein n=1 Tax=Panicum hallii TaxID=206008 RepID=A0A2T8IFI9_9POAL|nr:hypothetical protein PAHAL_6G073700 [Panicum hallii]